MTGQGLADYAISLLGSPYVYGVNGDVITEELIQRKAIQYPNYYTAAYIAKCRAHIGLIGYDCSSITDLYMGRDHSANGWLAACTETGPISTIPEIVGLIVHKDGHMGVYIGQGYVVEARGIDYGVVKTRVSDRPWTSWGKVPGIDYEEVDMLIKGNKGLAVTYWQKSLLKWDSNCLPKWGADSDFGTETETATKNFQASVSLPSTGMVDTLTFAYMLNLLANIVNPDPAVKAELDAAKVKISSLNADLATVNNQLIVEQNLSANYAQSDANKKAELQTIAKLFADVQIIKDKYLLF